MSVVGADDCSCEMSILMAGMPSLTMADGGSCRCPPPALSCSVAGKCSILVGMGEGVLFLPPSSCLEEEEAFDVCCWKIVAVIPVLSCSVAGKCSMLVGVGEGVLPLALMSLLLPLEEEGRKLEVVDEKLGEGYGGAY